MQDDLTERYQLGKYQPYIHHLDIGGGWQITRDTDEEGCEHKEGCQVDRDHRLKEERFEEICSINHGEDKKSRKVGGENLIYNPSLEYYNQVDSLGVIILIKIIVIKNSFLHGHMNTFVNIV